MTGSVIRPRTVEDPVLRLFLLHHAAGSHLAFTNWLTLFPADWDICLLEAPGRGRLGHLAPCDSAPTLANRFIDDLHGLLDAPFALFGHSMGGLIAYVTTLRLAERALPAPVWVGISACGSPRDDGAADTACPNPGAEPPFHTLPDQQLRSVLGRLGVLPPALLDDDQLWARLAPRVRADFTLVENWHPWLGERGRLRAPLSLFGGLDDPMVTPDALTAWDEVADRVVGQHFFPGGHFYFTGQEAALVDQIVLETEVYA
ncbi:alpha/beta fold hydrolase [Streptomyces sp. NPDC005865]|uniref:thioesterase II family protein n=1 Tax=Streptomyces sp. NPDC005865 TaxID=3155453 RepID=UPI0033F475AC